MKKFLSLLLVIISYIISVISSIWMIVEFVIYLVKDKPFNWNSLYVFIVSVIATILFQFIFFIITINGKSKTIDRTTTLTKSKFQQRLEDIAKQRGYKEQ